MIRDPVEQGIDIAFEAAAVALASDGPNLGIENEQGGQWRQRLTRSGEGAHYWPGHRKQQRETAPYSLCFPPVSFGIL